MINQVPELFGDVKVSFENHDDIGEGTRSKMLSILQDPTEKAQFKGRDGYCSLLWLSQGQSAYVVLQWKQ